MKPGATINPRASIVARPCSGPSLTVADDAAGDADGTDRVGVRLRIHHAAVGDDEIERTAGRKLREQTGGGEQRAAHDDGQVSLEHYDQRPMTGVPFTSSRG